MYRNEVIYCGHFFTYPSSAHPQPVWVRKGEKKLVCRIGLEIFDRTQGKCVKYPRKILKFSTYKHNNKNKLSRKFRHLANIWQCDNRAARAKFTVNSYFFPFENKEKTNANDNRRPTFWTKMHFYVFENMYFQFVLKVQNFDSRFHHPKQLAALLANPRASRSQQTDSNCDKEIKCKRKTNYQYDFAVKL